MTRLTAHFDSREFDCHDGTRAPKRWLGKARPLCRNYLEPLRDEFGPVTIISGFRTATHNRQVNGAPSSYHLDIHGRFGVAVDLECARGAPRDWHRFLDSLRVPGLGLYDDHVHADNRRGMARW